MGMIWSAFTADFFDDSVEHLSRIDRDTLSNMLIESSEYRIGRAMAAAKRRGVPPDPSLKSPDLSIVGECSSEELAVAVFVACRGRPGLMSMLEDNYKRINAQWMEGMN